MLYGKDRLTQLLLTIDEEATLALGDSQRSRYPVVIVGGSAFLLRNLTKRTVTHDVDILSCHEALRDILAEYHALNSAVSAYMDQIPYNFEDRLVRISLPTKTIDYLTPSLEDLVVMKLYGWRPNDQQDLESPETLDQLDWALLDTLIYSSEEARASALSPRRYAEMVSVYEEYAMRHGHEAHV